MEHSIFQAQRFTHTALRSRNSIRLLSLRPNSAYDAPLCCDLIDYDFDDGQGYEALSYAWDSQIPTSTIICNNQVLLIIRNCELALRRLRRAQWPRTLWIDSICIDQTSLQERSTQVALMDRIYGLADTVVVWLGDGDQRSYEAMDLVSKWSSTCQLTPSFMVSAHVDDELMLAKQKIVVCGSVQMSWVSFREGIAQAVPVIERDHPGFFQRMFPGFGLLDALKTPILAFPYRTFGLPLSEVLRLVRMRECSDPKDRIYALCAILRRQGLRLPTPDYNKSVRQIFTEAAHAAIIQGNSLELLSQLSCRSIADDLPSWVPDLTQRPWFPMDETIVVPSTEPSLKKASFTFSDDLEKLTTLGLPLDEVGPGTGRIIETNASYASYALGDLGKKGGDAHATFRTKGVLDV